VLSKIKIYLQFLLKEIKIDGTCSINRRDEKFVQNYCREVGREQTTRKARRTWEDRKFKAFLKEILGGGGGLDSAGSG
jgi:hypothetical protein